MDLPKTLSPLFHHMRHILKDAGIEAADMDTRLILGRHTNFSWGDVIAHPDAEITPEQCAKIKSDLERRLAGEPVSRIYGRRAFWGLEFKISPDTLDPRPDTETLIEVALSRFPEDHPPENIVDLGTGSGCILISLLKEWPGAQGVGLDRSEAAVRTAIENARLHDVQARSAFYVGSWGDALDTQFDLVVSNPPYISNHVIPNLEPEVKNHDPILALDGGDDGLQAYKSIFEELPHLLKPAGRALFEIGYDQEKNVVRLAEDSGLEVIDVHHDIGGQPRVVEILGGDK